MKRFPETEDDIKERAGDWTTDFYKLYGKSTGKRTLHVVVTHGTPIRMFSMLHGGNKKKMQFCGVTCVSITPKAGEEKPEFKILCNCKSKHLKPSSYCSIF